MTQMALQRINLRLIIGLNIKAKNVIILELNIRQCLCNLWNAEIPQYTKNKNKIINWTLSKLKFSAIK